MKNASRRSHSLTSPMSQATPRTGFTTRTCGVTVPTEELGWVPALTRPFGASGEEHAKATLESIWFSARVIASPSAVRPTMGYPIDVPKTIAGVAPGPQPVPTQVNEALELGSLLVHTAIFSEKCNRLASPALIWSPNLVNIRRVFRRRQISAPGNLAF